ncbi:MAG TPA: bifunctional tetrahydrofolate synthase/dihydrofolate synthase, partial [Pseudidiomarina sp.]|nr:bifunctional tetrahydrofolate synthase/dihydrofolate synthase [Pseudidiomarina sp.]
YFEFGTLAALWLLQRAQLDVWVLEVGLGGRLDAVNIIDADVPVLTSVGIDHVGFLGSDRGGIAVEKAGIFRSQRAAICGEPDFPQVALDYCQQNHVQLRQVGVQFFYRVAADNQSWSFQGVNTHLQGLPMPQLPLPNAATAIAALEALPLSVTPVAIREGLMLAREPGRLQVIPGPPEQLLDVAHNPHAASFLFKHLERAYELPRRPVYAVVGMLKDKDIHGTLAAIAPAITRWFCADLGPPRGARASDLAEALPPHATQVELFSSVAAAHQAACAAALTDSSAQPLVLVFGSFYTVASISTSE